MAEKGRTEGQRYITPFLRSCIGRLGPIGEFILTTIGGGAEEILSGKGVQAVHSANFYASVRKWSVDKTRDGRETVTIKFNPPAARPMETIRNFFAETIMFDATTIAGDIEGIIVGAAEKVITNALPADFPADLKAKLTAALTSDADLLAGIAVYLIQKKTGTATTANASAGKIVSPVP